MMKNNQTVQNLDIKSQQTLVRTAKILRSVAWHALKCSQGVEVIF